MNKKRLLFLSAVAAFLALTLTACGAKLTEITLPEEPLQVLVEGTAALEPSFSWEGDAPAEKPAVSYTSANEAVAAVDESGIVTGVAVGETTITLEAGEVKAAQRVVVVMPAEVLTVEDLSVHLAEGPVQAQVKVEPAQLADQLIYKTGDSAIATVNEEGVVNPVKEGVTSLEVIASDGTQAKATLTVWSGPKELALTVEKTQVAKGGSVTVAAADETGAAVDAAALVWSSSDEAVATVDKSGVVTMEGVGEVTITAKTAHGIAGSITLTGKGTSGTSAGSTGGTSTAGSTSGGTSSAGGTVTAPVGGQSGGAASTQPSQPAQPTPVPQPDPAPQPEQPSQPTQPTPVPQPDPAPQPEQPSQPVQPDPAPQPENPSGGHVHDSPTVDFTPGEGGNDLTDFWS